MSTGSRLLRAWAVTVVSVVAVDAVAGFAGTDALVPMAGRQAGIFSSSGFTTPWIYNPGAATVTARVWLLTRNTGDHAVFGSAGTHGVYGTATSHGVYGSSAGYAVYCNGSGGYAGTWGRLLDGRMEKDVSTLRDSLARVVALCGVGSRGVATSSPTCNLPGDRRSDSWRRRSPRSSRRS